LQSANWFAPYFMLDLEADGHCASSALFNGATRPFMGWVWDAALSAETRVLEGAVVRLTARGIGEASKETMPTRTSRPPHRDRNPKQGTDRRLWR
jgi:hypothetical protein